MIKLSALLVVALIVIHSISGEKRSAEYDPGKSYRPFGR